MILTRAQSITQADLEAWTISRCVCWEERAGRRGGSANWSGMSAHYRQQSFSEALTHHASVLAQARLHSQCCKHVGLNFIAQCVWR